jgi:hypothetical protein
VVAARRGWRAAQWHMHSDWLTPHHLHAARTHSRHTRQAPCTRARTCAPAVALHRAPGGAAEHGRKQVPVPEPHAHGAVGARRKRGHHLGQQAARASAASAGGWARVAAEGATLRPSVRATPRSRRVRRCLTHTTQSVTPVAEARQVCGCGRLPTARIRRARQAGGGARGRRPLLLHTGAAAWRPAHRHQQQQAHRSSSQRRWQHADKGGRATRSAGGGRAAAQLRAPRVAHEHAADDASICLKTSACVDINRCLRVQLADNAACDLVIC